MRYQEGALCNKSQDRDQINGPDSDTQDDLVRPWVGATRLVYSGPCFLQSSTLMWEVVRGIRTILTLSENVTHVASLGGGRSKKKAFIEVICRIIQR